MSGKQKRKNALSPQKFRRKYGVLLAFSAYLLGLIFIIIVLMIIAPAKDVYYSAFNSLVSLLIIGIFALFLWIPITFWWGWRQLQQGRKIVFVLSSAMVGTGIFIINLYLPVLLNPESTLDYHTNLNGVSYYITQVYSSSGGFSTITYPGVPYHKEGHISIYACDVGGWRCPVAEHSEIQIIWADGWYDITDDGTQIIVTYKDKQDGETKTYTYRPD